MRSNMKQQNINIMQTNLTVLRCHGMWPTYLNSKKDKFFEIKLLLAFASISVLAYGSISHLINVIIAKKQNVGTELLDDAAIGISSIGLYYIFFLFLLKRQSVTNLIYELEDFSKFGEPENVRTMNKTLNFYTKLFYFYCIIGGSTYFLLVQTVEASRCHHRNEQFDRDEICGFVTHMWLPFDYNYTPAYEIVGVVQLSTTVYAAPIITIFFTIFVMLQHLICKIRHLKKMAENIFATTNYVKQKERLINCIRYHQYIIRLCDSFNDCFGQISFFYITLGAVVLSITCYQSLKEISVASLLHLGVWVVSITTVCAAGQQLIDESESLAIAFYSLQWIDAENSTKLMLKIVIMRSQKPLSLKAFSVGVMSLSTFMAIMKSAYQYITLMKRFA